MDIGRPGQMTEGTVTACDACGEGTLVTERRNGRIVNEICTNITCERHPVAFNVKRIYDLIDEWFDNGDEKRLELRYALRAGGVLSLANHLFENLKL